MRAPASRGLEPWTRASVTSAADPSASIASSRRRKASIVRPQRRPVQRANRVEDRFRRAGRLELRLSVRVRRVDRVEDRRIDGDRQHQRRLADRLRAIDARRRIRPHVEPRVEDRRHVGGDRDLVGRRRVGGQPSLGVVDQLFGRQPAHALDEAALDLADVERRIDRGADVVQEVGAQDLHLAGQRVDRDLRSRPRHRRSR